MTDQTRETLECALAYCEQRASAETMWPSCNASDLHQWDDEDIVEWVENLARWGRRALALRDVLTPRTCSGCKSRHETTGACYRDVQDPEGEEVEDTRSPWNWRNRETFGCLDWQAREGER